MKRIVLVLSVIALSLALIGCSSTPPISPQKPPATPPPTSAPPTSGESGQTPPTSGESGQVPPTSGSSGQTASGTNFDPKKVYPAGTYEAGVDIPEGEYRITSDTYVRSSATVYADAAKSSVVYTRNTPRYYYVTVTSGQVLEVTDGEFTLASSFAYDSETTIYEGMHLVGSDCPAGIYQLLNVGGGDGYFCLYDGSGPDAKVVGTGTFPDKSNVMVSAGQYLELIGTTALLT